MPRLDKVGQFRTAYDKNRKIILASQSVCGICGQPVEKSLKYPHPLSGVVDHIIPLNKGGHPSDINNLQLAHRWCNRQKSDKLTEVRKGLKEENTINGELLPLHYDWKNYKAVNV